MTWAVLNFPFIVLIRLYQIILSPFMGGHCRFIPSCSHYGVEAFRLHNPLRASLLTAKRIGACHPWGRGGYDPVPQPESNETKQNPNTSAREPESTADKTV